MNKREITPYLLLFALLPFFLSYSNSFSQNYQWAKSIGGSADDIGNSIAVDELGNVFVMGRFNGTVDFDPGHGSNSLTPVQGLDIFFAKYDVNGNYLWAKNIDGFNRDYFSKHIEVDFEGSVYITGYFWDTVDFDPGFGTANLISNGEYDIFFAKYDGNGNYIWARAIGSSKTEFSNSLSIDAQGNTYITGYFSDTIDFDPGPGKAILISGVGADIFLSKYDGSGNYLWANGIIDYKSGVGSGNCISVDKLDYVYITGYFQGTVDFDPGPGIANETSHGANDLFFTKYNHNGVFLWAKVIGGPLGDHGVAIDVDSLGSVYLTGHFAGTADFDPGPGTSNLIAVGFDDIFFAKYDSSGNYNWAKNIGSSLYGDLIYDVATDVGGNVYITGHFVDSVDFDPGQDISILTSTGLPDMFVAKYNHSGSYLSVMRLGSNGDCNSITTDNDANIYITGRFDGTSDFDPGPGVSNLISAGKYDVFFAKYDSSTITGANTYSVEKSIHFYPNPNDGKFTIQYSEGQNYVGGKIELYNVLGEKLYSEKIIDNNSTTVDLNMPGGIYLLRVETEKEDLFQKMVIQ